MWNATHLSTCLLSMLVFLLFVDILLCKSECHSFVKAIELFYDVKCGMPTLEKLFTEYVGMPCTCRYVIVEVRMSLIC